MTLITTIEIAEIETEVSIEFKSYFGQPEVIHITALDSGDGVDVELDDYIYNEMAEMYADLVADGGGLHHEPNLHTR